MRLILLFSVVLNVTLLVILLIRDSGSVSPEFPVTIAESVSVAESLSQDGVLSEFEPTSTPQPAVTNQPRPNVSRMQAPTIPSRYELSLKVTPALPGFEGYEFQEIARPVHPAELLAAETEDPEWAADMESRIYEATQEPFGQVLVECRMTLCGIVVEMPAGGHPQAVIRAFDDYVTEKLGLTGLGTFGEGGTDLTWMAGYFKAERENRE